jgi:4'-phosphopantetheinyl transferase
MSGHHPPHHPRLPARAHRAPGPHGPWTAALDDLRHHGTALVHASLTQWLPQRPPDARLRTLLGRDWPEYQARAHRRNGEQFRVTRTLLKHLAAAALAADPRDLELARTLTGRPYLRGCDHIDLSLSHTGDLIAAAITTRGLIGVDVEPRARPLHGRGTEQRICTPRELTRLRTLPEDRRNPRLIQHWTLKEAYTKALGQGLNFPFDRFGFDTSTDPPALERADGSPADAPGWTFRSLHIADRYTLGAALYDDGRGRTPDPALATALDPGAVAAVHRMLRR